MASLDVSLYPVAVGVILLTVYVFQLFGLATRSFLFLHRWVLDDGTKGKEQTTERETSTFGLSSKDLGPTVEKESGFSLGWWTYDHIFQLERRAIFSKTWIYATHRSRFSKPGDYLTLNIVGFSFFLILGKDQVLRGFHNVCRHRAYEVTRKECGSSTVLGCRYHGWSYDTKGQLTKAPEFDTVPGFDKKENGLWEIHTKISAQGLVFVNLDAAQSVEELSLEGLEAETKKWNMAESERVAEWKHEGAFNWKLAAAASRGDSDDTEALSDIPKASSWVSQLLPGLFKRQRQREVQISSTTTVYWYAAQSSWLTVKILPQSATRTIVQCDLYTRSDQKPKYVESLVKKLKEANLVANEQLELMQKQITEDNLSLNDVQTAQQDAIHALLSVHRKLERSEGKEIHPAARHSCLSRAGQEDDDLCRELGRASAKRVSEDLATWSLSTTDSLDW